MKSMIGCTDTSEALDPNGLIREYDIAKIVFGQSLTQDGRDPLCSNNVGLGPLLSTFLKAHVIHLGAGGVKTGYGLLR